MTDSILKSIKKMLQIGDEDDSFDADVIMHINSVLFVLAQLGVGPDKSFSISGSSETWKDFLGETLTDLEAVKTYVYMKVRLIFDPPATGAAVESMTKLVNEFEWRLNAAAETKTTA